MIPFLLVVLIRDMPFVISPRHWTMDIGVYFFALWNWNLIKHELLGIKGIDAIMWTTNLSLPQNSYILTTALGGKGRDGGKQIE